jgi:hypothetical protein
MGIGFDGRPYAWTCSKRPLLRILSTSFKNYSRGFDENRL